jgi:hypothetical protein
MQFPSVLTLPLLQDWSGTSALPGVRRDRNAEDLAQYQPDQCDSQEFPFVRSHVRFLLFSCQLSLSDQQTSIVK